MMKQLKHLQIEVAKRSKLLHLFTNYKLNGIVK